MIPTNIHLKITQQPKGFRAFGRWCGDQKQLAKKLAAVLREEPELKEIFAELAAPTPHSQQLVNYSYPLSAQRPDRQISPTRRPGSFKHARPLKKTNYG